MVEAAAALAARIDVVAAWTAYALIHSLLAADSVKRWVARRSPALHAHYRLTYNGLALVLLLPLAWLVFGRPGPNLWPTGFEVRIALDALALLAAAALLLAGPRYDLRDFLGLKGRRGDSPRLHLSAWHRYVRHPWYGVGLVLVWTREMSVAWALSAICITTYFIVGSWLEEKKLIVLFGDAYRHYRHRVPALLPWRGQALTADEARALEKAAGS
jgi:protein-S-isoprenylcysteine O-methyltransferase Ste14